MMRLKVSIISILLLLITASAFACGIGPCLPKEYLLYRVYEYHPLRFNHLAIEPLDDAILNTKEGKEYMALAKLNEVSREEINSRWYYPSKDCPVLSSLKDIIVQSTNYKGTLLKDRYALQAARAMFSLGKFQEMRDWWSKTSKSIPEGVVKENIKGYVAGALFRTGEEEKALEYYAKIEDLESIIYCMKKMGTYDGDFSVLEYAATHCPDNRYLLGIMQRYFKKVEVYSEFHIENGNVERCYQICMKAANNPLCKNPDKWLYTAAFLKNLMGQPYVASNILARAEKLKSDDLLAESKRYLRILLDAQISTYNKSYEHKLLGELQWMDKQVKNHLCEPVAEETLWGWTLKNNYSYFYWNDMLKKIVLGTVVPRMIEAGKTPLALLLANYADNRMLELTESYLYPSKQRDTTGQYITISDIRNSSEFNMFDYSNSYFKLMDSIDVYWLKEYKKLSEYPVSSLEKFLCKRSYLGKDYLNELIGTRYLRNMNYEDAVKYLSGVSRHYQQKTNVSKYLNRNPFAYDKELLAESTTTAKLDFAQQMLKYQRLALNGSDDEKGEAMVMMGIGIRSSFDYCWALTQYHDFYDYSWRENPQTDAARTASSSFIKQGLAIIKDPEIAAECNLKLYRYRTIAKYYADTKIGEEVLAKCDNLRDYVAEKVIK